MLVIIYYFFISFYRRFKIRFFLNTKRTTIIAHFKIRKRGKYTTRTSFYYNVTLNISFILSSQKTTRFEYLHEKLSHIKKLVSDFDTQLTNSNEGGGGGDPENPHLSA